MRGVNVSIAFENSFLVRLLYCCCRCGKVVVLVGPVELVAYQGEFLIKGSSLSLFGMLTQFFFFPA